jgi:predicted HicB family RNase H-like nuclease
VKAVKETNQITIRIDMRVSEAMHKYLSDAAHARKQSYEGLLIEIIQERMDREKAEQLRTRGR